MSLMGRCIEKRKILDTPHFGEIYSQTRVGELTQGLCNLSISDTLGLTGHSTHYGSFPENPSQFGLE